MTTVIRAIDVGFGNTKFSWSLSLGGEVQCKVFPSIAPLAAAFDISGGVIGRRDTTVVLVDGNAYEIRPDVAKALGTRRRWRAIFQRRDKTALPFPCRNDLSRCGVLERPWISIGWRGADASAPG